jgi:ankyrin repeat protein
LITEVKMSKAVLERVTKKEGRSIVHVAAELGHDLMLYFFGEMGLDIDAVDSKGDSPLHLAVENKKKSSLRFLLSMNAELNVKNKQGRTPLHVAVVSQNVDAIKELLVKGANRNSVDNERNKPADLNNKVNEGPIRAEIAAVLGKACYSGCPLGRLPYMPIERNSRTMVLFIILFAYILTTQIVVIQPSK